ncbi:MAG: TldD/PmbA family protein, partial [Thaumarchaeota archaeon]|nr:TldD/PmbA family protein [Nitrososphaerota archaeon]
IITVRITDSEIAEIKHNQEESVAVRIINQKKIMSGSSSSVEKNLLDKVLENGPYAASKNFWKTLPFPAKYTAISKTYDSQLENISGSSAADIANTMINSALHNDIIRISGSLNIVSENFHVMNTNGVDCSDRSTFISGTINTDSQTGDTPVSGIGSICSRTLSGFS